MIKSINDVLTDNPKVRKHREDDKPMNESNYIEWQLANYNTVLGNLDKQDGIQCEKCLNRGYSYVKNEVGYLAVRNCGCMLKRRAAINFKKSGLSKRYENNTIDNFTTNEPWQKIMKDTALAYLESATDEWLVLSGQVGSGKSHIAVSVSKILIENNKEVRYLNFAMDYRSLRKRLMSGFSDVQFKAQKEFEELCNVEVLFIDDFLKLFENAEETFDLIDYRYANGLKTIITTEYGYNAMLQRSEAVASRIKQMTTDKYWLDIAKDTKKNRRL